MPALQDSYPASRNPLTKLSQPDRPLIGLAHGSRHPEGSLGIERLMVAVAEQAELITLPAYLDLAAGVATLNKKTKRVRFGAQMFGVLPEGTNAQVWFIVDTDGPQSGLSAAQLKEFGAPDTAFVGADLVIGAEIVGGKVRGRAWRISDGRPLPIREIAFDIHRLVMDPHFSPLPGREPPKIAGGRSSGLVWVNGPTPFIG